MSGLRLNTSCNLKGEPIVYTSKETFHIFSKSGMDTLVLGHELITLSLARKRARGSRGAATTEFANPLTFSPSQKRNS
jgi:hypothetical protein